MTTLAFWTWVGLAVVLGLAEIATGGFFMLPFAAGAAVAAVITALGATFPWQITGFAATTGAAFIATRLYLAAHNAAPPQPLAGNRLIGQPGVVLKAIDPVTCTGTVRVSRERWNAEARDGSFIPVGAPVTVTAVVGTHVVVVPAGD